MRSKIIVEWCLTIQHLFKNSPFMGNFNIGVEVLGWRCSERIEQHRANAVFFFQFIIYYLVLVLFLFSSCLSIFFQSKKNVFSPLFIRFLPFLIKNEKPVHKDRPPVHKDRPPVHKDRPPVQKDKKNQFKRIEKTSKNFTSILFTGKVVIIKKGCCNTP